MAVRRSGEHFPVEVAIVQTATRTGHMHFSGFLRDISERERAEASVERLTTDAVLPRFSLNVSNSGDRPRSLTLGAERFVSKPSRFDDLLDLLRNIANPPPTITASPESPQWP